MDVLERFHRNLSRVTLRGDGTQVDDADEVVKEMEGAIWEKHPRYHKW